MKDTQAKKALILKLMRGYPSSQERITEGVVASYLEAVEDVGLDALGNSVTQFLTGKVENRNNAFMPSAAELSANARLWQEAMAGYAAQQELKKVQRMVVYKVGTLPPPPLKPLGPIKMEIEGIMRDTSAWTYEEKMEALNTGKMPASRQIGAIGQKSTTPRLQKMTDKPRTA